MALSEQNIVKEIIQSALKKENVDPDFRSFAFETNDYDLIKSDFNPTLYALGSNDRNNENPFWRMFMMKSPDIKSKFGTYYHFKGIDIAKEILHHGEIQASNLASNRYEDYAEAEEFIRRYGNLYPLIPKDYEYGKGVLEPRIDRLMK